MYETIPLRTGKEFEEDLLLRAEHLEKRGLFSMGRYGVMVSLVNGKWMPTPSYPDLEGDFAPHGRHLIAEAKVLTERTNFQIGSEKLFKTKQKEHMYRRARVGSLCFLIIHFNPRKLKKCTILHRTLAMPVHPELPFWKRFEEGNVSDVSREEFAENGAVDLSWSTFGDRGRRMLPEIETLFEYQYAID